MTRMLLPFYAKVLVTVLQLGLSTSTLPSTCVSESSLNLSLMHLVSASQLEQVLTRPYFHALHCLTFQPSVSSCMVHCLSIPLTTHVMVSYTYGFFGLGDKFNCVCGQTGLLEIAKLVDGKECDQLCPVGGLQCGQPAKDLLR